MEDCPSPAIARGWCGKHYDRWRRHGDPLAAYTWAGRHRTEVCIEEGCSRPPVGRGWCERHYSQFIRVPQRQAARLAAKAAAGYVCQNPDCGKPLDPSRRSSAEFCDWRCKAAVRNADGRQRLSAQRHYFLKRYSLTLEQVDEMRAAGCAICGATSGPSERHGGQLHIDHDHVTGEVRGVLCDACNVGIGRFRDDPVLLARAAAYLTGDL